MKMAPRSSARADATAHSNPAALLTENTGLLSSAEKQRMKRCSFLRTPVPVTSTVRRYSPSGANSFFKLSGQTPSNNNTISVDFPGGSLITSENNMCFVAWKIFINWECPVFARGRGTAAWRNRGRGFENGTAKSRAREE